MIDIFIFTLFTTLIIVRLFSHRFHDEINFKSSKEKSKTLTYFLRKSTSYDIHHIHIGFILLPITLLLMFFFGKLNILLISLAISLSLIADQIVPYLGNKKGYFTLKRIFESIALHLTIAILYINL